MRNVFDLLICVLEDKYIGLTNVDFYSIVYRTQLVMRRKPAETR